MSNQQYCSKCCQDFDIEPLHLLFPHLLDEDGYEFVKTHGVENLTLDEISRISTPLSNGKVKVRHRCNVLTSEGLCAIYEDRPKICREYRCDTREIMVVSDRCEVDRRFIPLQVING